MRQSQQPTASLILRSYNMLEMGRNLCYNKVSKFGDKQRKGYLYKIIKK